MAQKITPIGKEKVKRTSIAFHKRAWAKLTKELAKRKTKGEARPTITGILHDLIEKVL